MRPRAPPVTYFRTTVSVVDLAALLPEWGGFEKLPRQKLEAAIARQYHFLHPQARAVVAGASLAAWADQVAKTSPPSSPSAPFSAMPMRTGPGKYAHSKLCGYGVSNPVTRSTGASR